MVIVLWNIENLYIVGVDYEEPCICWCGLWGTLYMLESIMETLYMLGWIMGNPVYAGVVYGNPQRAGVDYGKPRIRSDAQWETPYTLWRLLTTHSVLVWMIGIPVEPGIVYRYPVGPCVD